MILIGDLHRIHLAGLVGVNGGLGLHLPVCYLVQLGFFAPPFFIGHKRNGAAVVIKLVHLIRAGTPLRVRVLQVALVERLGIRHRWVQHPVEQGLPPGVRLFVRHHGLFVGFAGGDAFDLVVAVRGIRHHIRVFRIIEFPHGFKNPPVDGGAIVKHRVRVDVVGDHGFPIHLLGVHIGEVRRVGVPRAVAVGERHLRVIPPPQGGAIHDGVPVQRIGLFRNLQDW